MTVTSATADGGPTVLPPAAFVPELASVGAMQDQDSVALFRHNWSTYQKLLHVDYLEHRLLYGALQRLLGDLAGGSTHEPLAMLDLGCGDAMQIAATLARCGCPAGSSPSLASYTGVDVSAPALALAAEHLAFLRPACSVLLVEQDMAAYVDACAPATFNLAFASFAMHHLSTLEAKTEFMRHVARSLKPGGAFVLVDIFLIEGETRAQFMLRIHASMHQAVDEGVIEPSEGSDVLDHITNFDFPEQPSDLAAAAAAAGFEGGAEWVVTDSKRLSRLVVLRK
ncbi:ubiquinone biosynthesis [Micractinium conductrix]|uniref:Ubiquinone biosynthesis n=1 Tax=Micractinium conductrix TaxID=554055 RepID=A0A2P6VJ33_9CHLO|nr:ubiquinone biosynthesis [Micractinium conductrix]|eukprot:PSC74092.1 ubiquinone biosynthesis [Micractinium conductrix]